MAGCLAPLTTCSLLIHRRFTTKITPVVGQNKETKKSGVRRTNKLAELSSRRGKKDSSFRAVGPGQGGSGAELGSRLVGPALKFAPMTRR
ncbi:unnamed protein product [Clavelina lepadiformis]|uniref:Uncharacterized protein n=1 Tax=Clavelina lepadiformis TaxID=159417 RepID=A0ABP0F4L6_CLALP